MVAQFPRSATYRLDLAFHHYAVADILIGTEQSAEAEPEYRESIRLQRQLADSYPKNAVYRRELVQALLALADLLTKAGRVADAEKELGQALSAAQELAAQFPAEAEHQELLATVQSRMQPGAGKEK